MHDFKRLWILAEVIILYDHLIPSVLMILWIWLD